MSNDPNKEEWLSWREHPITEYFFQQLRQKREGVIDILAYRSLDDPRQQDKLVGRIAGYTDVLNTTFED